MILEIIMISYKIIFHTLLMPGTYMIYLGNHQALLEMIIIYTWNPSATTVHCVFHVNITYPYYDSFFHILNTFLLDFDEESSLFNLCRVFTVWPFYIVTSCTFSITSLLSVYQLKIFHLWINHLTYWLLVICKYLLM